MAAEHHLSGGFLAAFGNILFILSLLLAGVVFGYEKLLQGKIARMQTSLEAARQELNPDLIKSLSRTHARIVSGGEILSRHVTVSSFFKLLESLTLQSLRFTTFKYSALGESGITVQMKGEARDYKTVALQSDIFSKNAFIKDPIFSDLDLSEGGSVVFTFKSRIDPTLLLYERGFEGIPAETQSQAPAPAAPSPAPESPSGVFDSEDLGPPQL